MSNNVQSQRNNAKVIKIDEKDKSPNQKINNNKIIRKGSVIDDIDKLKQRRKDRKKKFEEDRKTKYEVDSNKIDQDYENLIKRNKMIVENELPQMYITSEAAKILVCVRKRPIFKKEILIGEIDCVSSSNPRLFVHECKVKIDGITKYVEDHEFHFDNVFGDEESTEDVYKFSIQPTIELILTRGIVTCFAYGQTGSGKTYTMKGIQNLAIDSIFDQRNEETFEFYVSFFEIYGGRLFDLLNNRNKLAVLEDKNQIVQIFGLEEKQVYSAVDMRQTIDLANSIRTTHNTVTNETSSRSHAICNLIIKQKGREETFGKLTLVDLAGSERAQETQSNDKNRRAEGAEINKSLLALKECIRALDSRKNGNTEIHVPFRASKLTLVLRDSFIPKCDKSKIIMIACVSPGFSSANHTINTLRYSDRLKERIKHSNKMNNYVGGMIKQNNFFKEPNLFEEELEPTPRINPLIMPIKIKQHKFIKRVNQQSDNVDNVDNWEYLQKSNQAKQDQNNSFIEFNEINEKISEEEEDLISTHIQIIKYDAKILTEEGELISNVKGLGESDFQMEEYTKCLDQIINKKISLYMDLRKKMEIYKQSLTAEINKNYI